MAQTSSLRSNPLQQSGSQPSKDSSEVPATASTLPQDVPTSTPQTPLETGEALLSKLKLLETRATEYNNLAMKVYAEEQACVKELVAQRKLVNDFLKTAKQTFKENKLKSRKDELEKKEKSEMGNDGSSDNEDEDDAPMIRNKLTPLPKPTEFKKDGSGVAPSRNASALKFGSGVSLNRLGSAGGWDEIDELREVVAALKRRISRIDAMLPQNAKMILRLALGNSAPFTLRPVNHRINYKKEVEAFKLRYTLILLALISICLFLSPDTYPTWTTIADSLFLFASLYYYSTLTLREHILAVNGSKITPWWFLHHYLSILLTSLLLITPQNLSTTFPQFRTQFLLFCAYLGGVQYLQYRYQRERLYVLVSLDKAERMDLVAGDGVFGVSGGSGGLNGWGSVLLPFLVLGQCWQLLNGYKCFVLFGEVVEKGGDLGKEWHILVVGILFVVLGLGNMVTTFWSFFRPGKKDMPSSLARVGSTDRVVGGGSALLDSLSAVSLNRMQASRLGSSTSLKSIGDDGLRKRNVSSKE
ncbi:UNVERIFIED_CONTAM: hypothetical protein HDU68_006351 [Siphonaria sp. JEL0065]|nr:hypothetical protein HDU68_006351 [Siphonaria sp. JEL0065]